MTLGEAGQPATEPFGRDRDTTLNRGVPLIRLGLHDLTLATAAPEVIRPRN